MLECGEQVREVESVSCLDQENAMFKRSPSIFAIAALAGCANCVVATRAGCALRRLTTRSAQPISPADYSPDSV
jgi:hypothetical protein